MLIMNLALFVLQNLLLSTLCCINSNTTVSSGSKLCVNKMFTRTPKYLYIYNSANPTSFLVVTEMSHAKSLDWHDSHLQCK